MSRSVQPLSSRPGGAGSGGARSGGRRAAGPVTAWTAALEGVVPDRALFSPWLRRLGRISFLGALDHSPGCRVRPTRLDHSAGVARLALETGRALGVEEQAVRLLVTAALLHDVGHFPLSHTAEPAFRSRWGVDHHDLSRWIVLGGGSIPREESLAPALEQAGLDPGAIWALIASESGHPLAPLLSASLNLDTLDGIPRAARAFGKRPPALPARCFALRDGRLVARREALPALDKFWALKNRVYRDVINAPAHAALELRISALVGRLSDDEPLRDLVSFDDEALLALLGQDRNSLAPDEAERDSRFVAADPGGAPVRILRQYSVDATFKGDRAGLPVEQWRERWKTSKFRWFLATRSESVQLLLPGCWEVEGDLP